MLTWYAANIDQQANTYHLEQYCMPCAMPAHTPTHANELALISDDEDEDEDEDDASAGISNAEDDGDFQAHAIDSNSDSDSLFQ